MDIILILIGLATGLFIAYIIFRFITATKYVAKATLEALTVNLNEAQNKITVAEERLALQQSAYAVLSAKFGIKEQERGTLHAKAAVLETKVQHLEEKYSNCQQSCSEERKLNLHLQNDINSSNQKFAAAEARNLSLEDQLKFYKDASQQQAVQINELAERNTVLNVENSKLRADSAALNEKLENQKEAMLELQTTSHLQFEKIANQILEEKSGKFTESNKANIEALLKPLGENIDLFKKKVEETYDKESKQRFSLEEKVKELMEQTNKVSSEANNLATALKGQVKKQGNWGEMILESILQQSGLMKNREYFLQQTIKDEEGKNLRPDVLVKLPDNRMIIIDSKVSLKAYDRFAAADSPEEQAVHLSGHLKSVYNHIDDLHGKKYDNLDTSLDFTMMFVPIEPAYMVSIQSDAELWAYAYSKRVLLISPTNLIACLKLMADLWKRELQSKNAMDIVKRGELLYEKFVTFATSLEDVGKHINRTQQSYTAAVAQLNSGSGHLVGQALKLKSLGLKSSKEIPRALLPADFDPEVAVIRPEDTDSIS